MALEAESRRIGQAHALIGAVEQRAMGDDHISGQAGLIHRKAVVLAGDHHPAALQFLHRMVGTVMAELHLQSLATDRLTQNLVAQTDAEKR